jgi:hypothetical protein
MSARWSGSELQHAGRGQLLFTPEQSARLRGVVAAGGPAGPLAARYDRPSSKEGIDRWHSRF